MSTEATKPVPATFEPWARLAFGLLVLLLVAFVILGTRPGGRLPVLLYREGMLLLGAAAGLLFAVGLVTCALRRPALQRGRSKALFASAATLWLASFPFPYPSSHEGHPSRLAFELPFQGTWSVQWGGPTREQNILALDPSRRFGWVFVPEQPEAEVLAPADGLLVSISDGRLVLGVGPGEYLVLGGLEPLSNLVQGQELVAGTVLGLAGEKGLTLHLEDRAVPGTGEGIPLRFGNVWVDGGAIPEGIPVRGQKVRPGAVPSS